MIEASKWSDTALRDRIARLGEELGKLRPSQLGWIEAVVEQLGLPAQFWRWDGSDLVTTCVLADFGDALRIHHCFSAEAFTKDKFEYALERVLNVCGIAAQRGDSRTHPGHDLTIRAERFSLKTQADKSIKEEGIHISKFMELGKGTWGDQESDYIALRERFFEHMSRYDRILTLRRLKSASATERYYELVEIPKDLLMQARDARLEVMHDTKQQNSKPAYYRVGETPGTYKFNLYFDGGGERKLQIKDLDKSLCQVHGTWRFDIKLGTAPITPAAKTPTPRSARRAAGGRGPRTRA